VEYCVVSCSCRTGVGRTRLGISWEIARSCRGAVTGELAGVDDGDIWVWILGRVAVGDGANLSRSYGNISRTPLVSKRTLHDDMVGVDRRRILGMAEMEG
jgi:hypothetical protein